MAKRSGKGLGRGIDSLIQPAVKREVEQVAKKTVEDEKVAEVVKQDIEMKIGLIEPNREQPRKYFDEDSIMELADSIKQHGLIQPIVVVKKDEHYEIVTGERRWRAAKKAGLEKVPVLVKELSEQKIMELSLIENLQREDLNPIEEALAYQKLMKTFDLKQEEVAVKVSKSRTAIANSVRLLKLDDAVQEMVIKKQISGGHARALLGLESKDEQYDLAMRIIEESLSVRETEEIVKEINNPTIEDPNKDKEKTESREEEQIRMIYEEYENMLKKRMGTKVKIKKKKNDKGKIEIEYYSLDELERLLDMFNQIPE